jgi:hypothetical protein
MSAETEKLLEELVYQLKIASNDPSVWEIVVIDVDTPIVVKAKDKLTIVDSCESGKLIAVAITTTDKDTIIEFEIDNILMRTTPAKLYDDGLVGYNTAYLWLSRYDETENKYVVWFTPVPDRPYFSRLRIEATPQSNALLSYSCYRYRRRKL